jgi:hypothetical protein
MFYDPRQTFSKLRSNPRGWLPAVLITGGTALIVWWYYQTVDFPWLIDHQHRAMPDLNANQRDAAAAMMRPRVLTWSSVLGTLVLMPLLMAFHALVYLITSKFIGSEIRFSKWFALAAWSSVPRLLCFPLMVMQILGSNGQLSVEDLNIVSFNYLVLRLPIEHPWAGLANDIDLASVWAVVLAAVGIRVWTDRGIVACSIIAALPIMLVYGLWAGKIVMFG